MTPIIDHTEIKSLITSSTCPSDYSVFSAGDLFFALESVRKDSQAGGLHSALKNGTTPFQRLCRAGGILCLPLTAGSLIDGVFVDPYSEVLELDSSILDFQSIPPVESVRALNMKELRSWNWD